MISELPINVLLRIMEFTKTKDAVKTCVLSKHWKDLWKSLTCLKLDSCISSVPNFDKFVSGVLSNRDASISLLNLHIVLRHSTDLELLNNIMKYAVLHNVQHLTIFIFVYYRFNFVFPSLIFSCPSLTHLHLSPSFWGPIWKLPKSLHLPALKTLHLENVCFTAARGNDCAEPFSSCVSLNSLALIDCSLVKHAKALCVNNSNLDRVYLFLTNVHAYKIVLSTPNLTSLTIRNYYCDDHQLCFTCDLSSLEVVIDSLFRSDFPFFVRLLQLLANVKKITLSLSTLEMMQYVTQPYCFVRLESVKVTIDPGRTISYQEVNSILKYLLRNSPQTTVEIIKC